MKTRYIGYALFAFLLVCLIHFGQTPPADKTYRTISGYENGELVVSTINVWDRTGGLIAGAYVVGHLPGEGSYLEILDTKLTDARLWLKVRATNGKTGWITNSFIN